MWRWAWIVWAGVAVCVGCGRGDVAAPEAGSAPPPVPAAVQESVPRFVSSAAVEGGLSPALRTLRAQEATRGRDLIVYVGASWCEPCRRFHDAVADGSLDGVFPSVTFVEFDLDVDKARLAGAGCDSRMIPLFAVVEPETGRCGARIAGAIKGPGAVNNIAPRLTRLLDGVGELPR